MLVDDAKGSLKFYISALLLVVHFASSSGSKRNETTWNRSPLFGERLFSSSAGNDAAGDKANNGAAASIIRVDNPETSAVTAATSTENHQLQNATTAATTSRTNTTITAATSIPIISDTTIIVTNVHTNISFANEATSTTTGASVVTVTGASNTVTANTTNATSAAETDITASPTAIPMYAANVTDGTTTKDINATVDNSSTGLMSTTTLWNTPKTATDDSTNLAQLSTSSTELVSASNVTEELTSRSSPTPDSATSTAVSSTKAGELLDATSTDGNILTEPSAMVSTAIASSTFHTTASTTRATAGPSTVITLGQHGLWQYSFSPNSTCSNCTVTVDAVDLSVFQIEAYLIVHGVINLRMQTTSAYMKVFLGNEQSSIGSVESLAVNYTLKGSLVPLFSSNRTIRFENFYPYGLKALFPKRMAFFFRLTPAKYDCGRPLVYVCQPNDVLTIAPAKQQSDHCYVTVYTSQDDPYPVLSFYDWNIQAEHLVTVIPGWDDIPFNEVMRYTALSISESSASNSNGIFIATPRANLLINASSPIVVRVSNTKPRDYSMDQLIIQGSNGFFMGAYPDYSELQLFSMTGDPLRIDLTFTRTRLSNSSKIVVTSGASGTPQLELNTDEISQRYLFSSEQLNVKFSPGNNTMATFALRYTVENGKKLHYLSYALFNTADKRELINSGGCRQSPDTTATLRYSFVDNGGVTDTKRQFLIDECKIKKVKLEATEIPNKKQEGNHKIAHI
uniref:CUB-like domain-containing protein n=1 Tax=Ascaris lumbricoides TaxID=6252 RepID=A0A9J2PDU8_ASCLU